MSRQYLNKLFLCLSSAGYIFQMCYGVTSWNYILDRHAELSKFQFKTWTMFYKAFPCVCVSCGKSNAMIILIKFDMLLKNPPK